MALLTQTLPARLRKLRAKAGISQFKAAVDSGLSHGYYHRLEQGRENPSLKVLVALAELYGLSLAELLHEHPNGR